MPDHFIKCFLVVLLFYFITSCTIYLTITNLGIFWFPNFALKMTNILAPGTIIYKAITGVSVSLNSISPMEVFAWLLLQLNQWFNQGKSDNKYACKHICCSQSSQIKPVSASVTWTNTKTAHSTVPLSQRVLFSFFNLVNGSDFSPLKF